MYISQAMNKARCELAAFEHRTLIRMLQRSPAGVSLEALDGVSDNGVMLNRPVKVAAALKNSEAVLFNIEQGEYRLQSRMYATALASMDLDAHAPLILGECNDIIIYIVDV